ncbi:MAG: spore coat associated protein CotJA [Ruminococcus sp.]|nr:spore coat associated protein CotJA [Ruminococcus sp.]
MAYVPYQSNNPKFYSHHHGFESGTIFPSLHKPFMCYECMEEDDDNE